jgi:hypothetical protein
MTRGAKFSKRYCQIYRDLTVHSKLLLYILKTDTVVTMAGQKTGMDIAPLGYTLR